MFTKTLAALAVTITAVIGAPHDGNLTVREVPRNLIEFVSDCGTDPVYVDVATRIIFGDQDENGRLDGDDCNWQ